MVAVHVIAVEQIRLKTVFDLGVPGVVTAGGEVLVTGRVVPLVMSILVVPVLDVQFGWRRCYESVSWFRCLFVAIIDEGLEFIQLEERCVSDVALESIKIDLLWRQTSSSGCDPNC